MKNDILVKCCRCKNQHRESERVSVPSKTFGMRKLVCPRCRCGSYFDQRPYLAWCFASGLIEFGEPGEMPEGAILICTGPKTEVKQIIEVAARHSRTNGQLLVPGVPEASDQDKASDALAKWIGWFSRRSIQDVAFNIAGVK